MTKTITFYYDLICPFAYLASTQITDICKGDVELKEVPVFLATILLSEHIKDSNYIGTLSPQKAKYIRRDLQRYATLYNVPFNFPAHHPKSSNLALRCLYAVGPPYLQLSKKLFHAYWVDGLDFSDEKILKKILKNAGVYNPIEIIEKAKSQEIKQMLEEQTEKAVGRKVFGVPSFLLNLNNEESETLFYGQDRLNRIRHYLGQQESISLAPVQKFHGNSHNIEFIFDYGSPWSYICFKRIGEYFGHTSIRYRPIDFGSLIKDIGAPKPMGPKKRIYTRKDLLESARLANKPFVFNTHRPLKTVLALRLTIYILENERQKAESLINNLFEATWVENKNISESSILIEILNQVGLDGRMIMTRAILPKTLTLLKQNVDKSVNDGVFGIPSILLETSSSQKELFWGNDRLEFATMVARDMITLPLNLDSSSKL